jgi:predicted secreted hydrolase
MTERGRLLLPSLALGVLAAFGVLAGCESREDAATTGATPPGLSGIRYLAAGDAGDDDGYARALTPRAFEFPADHAPHPAFRTEWWYFTGNVFDRSERHYGFELTLFRVALAPAAVERASTLASHQVWMGHLAVTDTRRDQFQTAERLSRGAPGLAGAATTNDGTVPSNAAATNDGTVTITLEDWSVAFDGSSVALAATADGFGIELALDGLERIVRQGDDGLDAKGPESGNASYYFSAPRLRVVGEIESAGEAPVEVAGTAWMDREWSTSALSAGMTGWDWFALQLDDGRELMYYRLREVDGDTSPFSGGSLVGPAGDVTRLDADDVELSAVREWVSPNTGIRYPVAWQLGVPAAGLALEIRPRIDGQELDLSVRYWEGAVSVSGRAGDAPIGGVGYLELAGY